MEDKTRIRLTAAEMAGLWTQYINDTSAVCVNRYFLEKVEDEEVRPIIEGALHAAKENLSIIEEIFQKEKFPIPVGFTEDDVNPQAPNLFTDTFFLVYLNQMATISVTMNGIQLGVVTRPDIVTFHKRILKQGQELLDQTRDLMLRQGVYIKPPSISIPDEVDFVKQQQFLAGFFGKKRSLTAMEITHLYVNILTNGIGKDIIMAFAQTASNKEIKQYFKRGKDLSHKYIDIFSDYLTKEDLPAPAGWDSHVLDSTTAVFSDKLMLYIVSAMISIGIGNIGASIAGSLRRDLGAKYATILPEIVLYAEDGANLMIKNGWMEEPPQADDRDQLMGK